MSCDKIRPMIGPFHDGELLEPERRAVTGHLDSCDACTAAMKQEAQVAAHLGGGMRLDLPPGLDRRIAAALDMADREARDDTALGATPAGRTPPRWSMGSWAQAAAVAACVVSGTGGWYAGSLAERSDRLTHDVLQAHVRSLLQDNPVQVASSDSHTVRPWFAGKIDVAPGVIDHAAEGFPLIGGRLDVIGDTRAGVVVYKHNLHWINIYMWPAAGRPDGGPVAVTRNGYNMLNWTKGGIAHWAVSDLNMSELRQLQGML